MVSVRCLTPSPSPSPSLSLCDLCFPLPLSPLPLSTPPDSNSNSNSSANANAHRVTDLDRAILQLKTQRRQLEGAAARTSRLVEREREAALAALLAATRPGKNREVALAALRRKRLHESRLATVDANLLSIESALAGIDEAKGTASVVSALRAGADALKALRASAPLAEVEAILEDSRAAAEYERGMQALLEGAGTGLDAAQEASVEKELGALVEEEQEKEARREEAGRLPEAPRREVVEKEKEEEDEVVLLPSAPTGLAVVVGGGGLAAKEGTEEEPSAAKAKEEKERVPVLA